MVPAETIAPDAAEQVFPEGQLTPEETRLFWFMASCAMVPGTDHLQLTELLPWVLRTAGMDKYMEVLEEAFDLTRLRVDTMPESMENVRSIVTLALPGTEAFDADNWSLQFVSIRFDKFISRVMTLCTQFMNHDYSSLPESVQKLLEEQKAASESGDSEEPEEAAEKAQQVFDDTLAWLKDELSRFIFFSSASAGQDGSLIKMVVRPGRAIPILMHVTVNAFGTVPDEVVCAVYLNGKWYDLKIGALTGDEDSDDLAFLPILLDLFGAYMEKADSINGIEDVLDLFILDVKGGEVLELSSEGLDQIDIPAPTPEEELEYGVIIEGPKSRPKTEEDTDAA